MQALLFLIVVYIGEKPFKRDLVYGTNLSWTPGQENNVEAHIANQMVMRHPDVYALKDSDAHKAFLAGEKPATVVAVQAPVKTTAELIAERVALLAKELKNCTKVEQVETHELVAKLGVQFTAEDTKRQHKEARIVEAYQQYLEQNADKLTQQGE